MEYLKYVEAIDSDLAKAMDQEFSRQQNNIELIASENFVSRAVMAAQGSCLTNKYAEGYPGKRYYGGCEFVDVVEDLARKRALEIFGGDHVNVQPHSGSQANTAVYICCLKPGDTVLGMNLSHGGHLTHGNPINISGLLYNFIPYGVKKETELIDYEELERLAVEHKPKLIVAGASAYPRKIEFDKFKAICDKVGALLMVDMAHIAGLVAAGLHQSPIPYADFVTTTTHKTLRGPRGGMIFCKKEWAAKIDKTVFPGVQGGPLMHVIAAKAVCFKEALEPSYKLYQEQVVKNAKVLGDELMNHGLRLVSGGTDNHLILVDLQSKNITGKEAEARLDRARITANKNTIPFDPQGANIASGIRIGTPAATTRGMKEDDMKEIAKAIDLVVSNDGSDKYMNEARGIVELLTKKYPLYAE